MSEPVGDGARCMVNLIHADEPEARCTRHRDHQQNADSDHVDEHGCTAHVLVHQSSIEEARRWQDVPWPWEDAR